MGKAEKLLTLPCIPARVALKQLFDPPHFLRFPPREVNFTAAQATAFN